MDIVLASPGERAIRVRAIEVLLYVVNQCQQQEIHAET